MDLIEEARPENMGFALNGCAPRWIHFLSDSDVPIVPCEFARVTIRNLLFTN